MLISLLILIVIFINIIPRLDDNCMINKRKKINENS